MINILKHVRNVEPGITRLMNKVSDESLSGSRKAMAYTEKLLQVAELGEKTRFSEFEIKELISTLNNHITELSKYDLVKTLLSIGIKKGKPMTTRELKSFLDATSGLSQKELDNVIKFAREIKETNYPQYDAKYIMENHTFDFYKKTVINRIDWMKKLPIEDQKIHYNNAIAQELKEARSKNSRDLFEINEYSVEDFISPKTVEFVKNGIAKCKDPEIFAKVASQLGITQNTTYAADDLVTAYKKSNGDIGLMEDLNRCFYPAEIKQIIEKTESFPKDYVPVSVIQIFEHVTPEKIRLDAARKAILKNLNLDGKIKLLPLQYREYVDVYMSGAKISGKFEKGKKR